MQSLNVLLLTSDLDSIKKITELLQREIENLNLQTFDSLKPVKKALDLQPWDVFLLDANIESCRYTQALEQVKGKKPGLLIILLLNKLTEDIAVTALKKGANDLVVKDRPERLIPALFHGLERGFNSNLDKDLIEDINRMLDSSDSFITLIGRDFRYKAINETFCRAHNLKKRDVLGKTLASIWGVKKFREMILPHLETAFKNKKVTYEAWFETPTLGMRFFRVSFLPNVDKNGFVISVIVETKDITEQKSTSEKLEVTRNEVDSIIENSNDYFWSIDRNYKIIYVNKPFKKIFRKYFNGDIAKGSNILEFLSGKEARIWKKKYDSCLEGTQQNFERTYFFDGQPFYFEVNMNPVFGKDGVTTGITCFARNVTRRKKIEEKIKHQAEDLSIINKMNLAVNKGWDYKRVINLFSKEIGRVFNGIGASVYLLSKDKKYLTPVKFAISSKIVEELKNLAGSHPSQIKIYLKPFGYYKKVISSGKINLANTPALMKKLIIDFFPPGVSPKLAGPILKYLKYKSILSIPLSSEQGVLGVLGMAKTEVFENEEIHRLSVISDQVSLILQRVRNLEIIQESETRYRKLYESANDAIFILENNIFSACNKKTLELFQCNENDIVGRSPVDLSPVKQPDGSLSKKLAREKISAASKGKPVRFDWVHQRPNGTLINCDVSLSLVKYRDNSYIQAIVRDNTFRIQSEKKLRESEQKFRTLFVKGHFAMIHLDVKNNKKEMNEAFAKLFGYSQQELTSIKIPELTHEEDRPKTIKVFGDLVSGKTDRIEMEKRYLKKNGDIIWGLTGGTSIKNEMGEVAHVIIMIMDSTNEKKAEIKARQKTNDLLIINQLNMMANRNESLDDIMAYFSEQVRLQFFPGYFMLFSWNRLHKYFQFRYMSVNETIRKQLFDAVGRSIKGYVIHVDEENIFGKLFSKKEPWLVKTPREIDRLMIALLQTDELYKKNKTLKEKLEIKSALNFPLLIENEIIGHAVFTSTKLIKNGMMERLGFIMEQFTGILKRKLAEEEEAKLKTVIEQLTETVVITDVDGKIQYVNPAFETISGYSLWEVVGKNPSILKSDKQSKAYYRKMWDTILAGKSWSNKIVNKKKNGELYEEKITITPVKDENGSIVNFVAVKRDITRESQLEQQLLQSQKLETIGTLAGGIAHDFNNILGTLLGYNEMVLEDIPEHSKAFEYSMNMNATMNRARTLVNQILTFSRKMKPESHPVNLAILLNESLEMFKPAISPHVKITKSICDPCPDIIADPSQMQQVFMNLLTNANQAFNNNPGNIKIKLSVIPNSPEIKSVYESLTTDKLIFFSICDNGPGIPEKIRSRIFEPFFTTKPVGTGTGLGLSVVHGIIQAHSGVIQVHSDQQKGTCFMVYLPVK